MVKEGGEGGDAQWEVHGFKKICVDFGGLFLRNATKSIV